VFVEEGWVWLLEDSVFELVARLQMHAGTRMAGALKENGSRLLASFSGRAKLPAGSGNAVH
jgi:hypothetical protein